jgi:hypothetical protein
MVKNSPARCFGGNVLPAGAFSCLFALSALAQNSSPAPAIGPAPANSKQHQILDSALSSHTRQTLQEAMNSAPSAPSAK